MPKPLSVDLRTRVVSAYAAGTDSQGDVAIQFGVGQASVRRWVRRKREEGTLEPRPAKGGPERKLGAEAERVLLVALRRQGDRTRDELADDVAAECGITVSVATIGRTLARLKWTRKKSR